MLLIWDESDLLAVTDNASSPLWKILAKLFLLAPLWWRVCKKAYHHCPIIRALVDPLLHFCLQKLLEHHRHSYDHHSNHCRTKLCDTQDEQQQQDHHCCPKRLARHWKCERRRRRQRRDQEARKEDECVLTHFCKLHLPPPLPFLKRHRKFVVPVPEEDDAPEENGSHDTTSTSQQDDETSASEDSGKEEAIAIVAPTKQPRTQRPARTAHLIDLVRMQHWESIIDPNTTIKRREAKYKDAHGLYPLHWATAGSPPLAVVERLLQAYPSAVRKVDQEGSLPLHFAACYSASNEVVVLLKELHPTAITRQDRFGRTPLYHATEKSARLTILQLLSEGHSQILTTPCHAKSKALSSGGSLGAQQQQEPSPRQVAMRTPLYLVWTKVLSDHQSRTSYKGKNWDKAEWMLRNAHQHHHPDNNGSLLKAAIHMDIYLPEAVVSLLVAARPELVRIPDPTMLPLSQAAGTRSYSLARWEKVLHELLQAYPDAALVRPAALHQAIRVGRPIGRLLAAAPEVADWRDKVSGLPSALLAASTRRVPKHQEHKDDLSPSSKTSDPFNLLSSKEQEFIDLRTSKERAPETLKTETVLQDPEHLGSIYELLRSSPLQISARSHIKVDKNLSTS